MEVEAVPLYTPILIIAGLQVVMLETFFEFIIHRHILTQIHNFELISFTLSDRDIRVFLVFGTDTSPIDNSGRKYYCSVGLNADVVAHGLE